VNCEDAVAHAMTAPRPHRRIRPETTVLVSSYISAAPRSLIERAATQRAVSTALSVVLQQPALRTTGLEGDDVCHGMPRMMHFSGNTDTGTPKVAELPQTPRTFRNVGCRRRSDTRSRMLTYGPTRRSSCSGRSQSNPTPVSPSPSGTITRASDAWSVMSSRHIPHGGTTSPHRCTATIVSISVSPSAAARPIATASAETDRRLQMHRTGHHSGSCPQCTTDLLPALFGAPSDDLACHRSEQTIALRACHDAAFRPHRSVVRS
jgi:hypothetical protein